MQQQSMQMMKSPPGSISTEEVQKLLDENKSLILAILENQNIGKSTECALYQAQLQNNLMFLAAIADAQPTAPTVPSQNPLQSVVQQEHYMQQAEAATPLQQPNPKFPFQLNNTPLSV
ncbi:GRF1-interacting factor 2-like [Diospyros lotus]|uniref:GRF1-interacting factor 2-like n=1 Tax=Diospyros lotus TaxID=55363 RepID=UPI0022501716|nr:GRF1-interacting factor 2-like [Diospyros lotus]